LKELTKKLNLLQGFIEQNDYKGYDPYDALKSPLFKLPFFKTTKILRFGAQQVVKRFPINLRPLLLVPKGYNPVTLGLSIQGYAYLSQVYPNQKEVYHRKIIFLVNELKTLIPKGFSGACWGYDFDWEARYAKIGAYQPTVVATGIISNALYVAWEITRIKECANLVESAADFVLKDLKRSYRADTFCFSYSPFDEQSVFNASMKGVRLLAQTYAITKNEKLKTEASAAAKFVIKKQNGDGSGGYSLASGGDWIDNYHTGYILDCLDDYINLCDDLAFKPTLEKGFQFYKNKFITKEGMPQFYADKVYPIDCTAAGQTLLTLTRFGEIDTAKSVASWMVKNMQNKKGGFYFRKYSTHTEKTTFMRWSNAWMFVGLAYLISQTNPKV
jgi:hypothetical protein